MTEAARDWLAGLEVPGRPDEHETKRLLAAHGLSVPEALRVPPRARGDLAPGDQGSAGPVFEAPAFDGPYVVKVRSPEVLHKSDRQGVQLGVDRAVLAAAVGAMLARFPGHGALVERQISFTAPEFIVGAFRDPAFGPAVMVGAGGILTELYQDVAFRLVPCSAREALRMLRELAVFPALEGFRGQLMDPESLARVIARVSGLVEELGQLFSQLDLNPLVFTPRGWTVLDAKLILAGAPSVAPS